MSRNIRANLVAYLAIACVDCKRDQSAPVDGARGLGRSWNSKRFVGVAIVDEVSGREPADVGQEFGVGGALDGYGK